MRARAYAHKGVEDQGQHISQTGILNISPSIALSPFTLTQFTFISVCKNHFL